MKKNLMLALVGAALMFAFVGCAPAENATTTEGTATTASAEKVACADCGSKYDKSAMKDTHGNMLCISCSEKHEASHEAVMYDCVCGKQVAASQVVELEGKKYCKDCADKMKEGASSQGTTPETGKPTTN